ncbi:hypothetical protein FH972_021371 [Carpinus fangiana]|uniref:Uncharacterized protein n=1 Tax=Carpinus fangiana TaxID=176857 RepID=A0A5N6KRB6_9ROSI|nr:hypothetical protein FH972_021371 [Carpinus fangiana]
MSHPDHSLHTEPQYATRGLGANLHMPQNPQQGQSFPQAPQAGGLPGLLQPGGQHRLDTSSGYSSSSSTTPANMQPYSPYDQSASSRPTTHSYSRSSPSVAADQKYIPFSHTPDTPKYPTSGSSRYPPQTPTGAPSHSPLALADIRPRPELHLGEISSPSSNLNLGGDITQTSSSYVAPWPIYAYDWCNWPLSGQSGAGKMAICSYLEDPHNFIQILDTHVEQQHEALPGHPQYGLGYSRVAEATCSYPVTRILWEPPSTQKQTTDLLATSGDHLRLWSLPTSQPNNMSNSINRSSASRRASPSQKLTPLALLSNSKTPEHTAPLTSLDWNQLSPKLIITSSIDTTCTIWDIPTLTAKTQLIAHDKEVFDVRFCAGSVDTFVSCGADGSVRMFDLRSLEHSTIIYEPSEQNEKGPSPGPMSPGGGHTLQYAPPLLRLAASPHDSHLLATFAQDSKIIRILDHRQPGQALLELHGHSGDINAIEWSPTRRGMLASGGDDSQVLYWDLINPQNAAPIPGPGINGSSQFPSQPESANASMKGPAASWRCDHEASNISWAPPSQLTGQGGDWLGVVGGRAVWGVKV